MRHKERRLLRGTASLMVLFVQEKLSKSLPSVVVRSRSRNAGGRGDCLPKRPVGWGIHFRWFFSLQYGLLLTCICRQRIWGARSWAQLFWWSSENFNFGCHERSCLWRAFLSTLLYGTIHNSITRIMPPISETVRYSMYYLSRFSSSFTPSPSWIALTCSDQHLGLLYEIHISRKRHTFSFWWVHLRLFILLDIFGHNWMLTCATLQTLFVNFRWKICIFRLKTDFENFRTPGPQGSLFLILRVEPYL